MPETRGAVYLLSILSLIIGYSANVVYTMFVYCLCTRDHLRLKYTSMHLINAMHVNKTNIKNRSL